VVEPRTNAQDVTSPSLLRRIRDPQDSGSWQVFVQTYGPLVYAYCRRSRLEENDAADVSQEVLMRVSNALKSFEYDPEKGRFRYWLGRIVLNEISRFFKSKGKRQSIDANLASGPGMDGIAGEEHWNEHFQTAILDSALKRIESEFEPETWKAFEAAWLQDLPSNEVAQRLSIQVEKVYVAKSRVLKRLKEELLLLCEDIPSIARLQ
jgi:RNA polymerase sigma factor (sigma-70 family)